MQEAFLMIYPALWIVMIFYGAGVSKKGETASSFLCLEQSKMIQACACIGIILHHVTQQITVYGLRPKGPVTIFSYTGFIFSGLFFFFSGYGLILSLDNKADYLKTFLQKRLPAVLIPFWFINLCIVLSDRFFFGVKNNLIVSLKNIFGITLINGNGWFIIEIVILYLIFYSLFWLIRNRDIALFLLCLCTVIIILFGFGRGHDPSGNQSHWFRGEWWFNSTIAFAFGLVFARFRATIVGFSKRFYPAVTALSAITSVLLVYASYYTVKYYGYYHDKIVRGRRDALLTLGVQMLACIVITYFVVLLNMKVTLGNPVLKRISSIQLPLFLVHGYFANRVFGGLEISDFIRYGVVLLSGIAGAALLALPTDFLVKEITKRLTSIRIVGDTLEAKNREKLRQRRNKILRITGAVAVVLCLLTTLALTIGRSVILGKEFEQEIELIKTAKVGDVVAFGRFDTDLSRYGKERVSWIIVKDEGEKKCLLSEKGLGGSYYYQRHEEISWEGSDLRKLLAAGEYSEMFSADEVAVILPQDGDMLTLLTVKEAQELFSSDEERELDITDAAEKNGTNVNILSKANNWDMKNYRSSWWWLRGDKGINSITAPIVTVDGVISPDEKPVNKPGGAIRQVIWVDINKGK